MRRLNNLLALVLAALVSVFGTAHAAPKAGTTSTLPCLQTVVVEHRKVLVNDCSVMVWEKPAGDPTHDRLGYADAMLAAGKMSKAEHAQLIEMLATPVATLMTQRRVVMAVFTKEGGVAPEDTALTIKVPKEGSWMSSGAGATKLRRTTWNGKVAGMGAMIYLLKSGRAVVYAPACTNGFGMLSWSHRVEQAPPAKEGAEAPGGPGGGGMTFEQATTPGSDVPVLTEKNEEAPGCNCFSFSSEVQPWGPATNFVTFTPPAAQQPGPPPSYPPGFVPGGGGGWSASPVAPIPEPSTYALMALGLAVIGWVSRRKIARRV